MAMQRFVQQSFGAVCGLRRRFCFVVGVDVARNVIQDHSEADGMMCKARFAKFRVENLKLNFTRVHHNCICWIGERNLNKLCLDGNNFLDRSVQHVQVERK